MKKIIKGLIDLLPLQLKYKIYRSFVRISTHNMDDIIFKLAETREELEGAFSILHDSYVDVGLMKKDPSGLRVTPYHALNSSVTLIGKKGNEVIATLTIISDSKLGLPSDNFVDLSKLRRGGNRIAEISALAIKKEYRGRILFHLLKYMYEWCVNYLAINHLIATLTTDTKSYELYEAILFFKRIENKVEANYAFSNFRPVIAEHLNLDEAKEIFKNIYHGKDEAQDLYSFFVEQKTPQFQFPKRTYFTTQYPVMTFDDFSYFFTERTQTLSSMSENALLAIRHAYKNLSQTNIIDQELKRRNIFALNRFSYKLRFDVSLYTMGRASDTSFRVKILDISESGLKISSDGFIGQSIEISVPTLDGKTKIIVAKKIWEDEFGVAGLQITSADQNWYNIINHLSRANEAGLKVA